ncbi:hypothetical protein QH494_08595 [Sphingomonas sp. AR_OL41]|uniref:hypothetical protein n=1 Tax=Sphingomonas sp. AR_OL41 TaxID=3042729 RepID=UPI00248012FA|nr:hypothetical protein [Sphingomonas sp. AR_OL41]MDH7972240.1 hypothetical protein [Sphingomonas sp. AR_OL41]
MFGLLRLLFGLPWWAYILASPVILAAGIFGYFSDQDSEAAKMLARHRPPPAAVAIERFDAKRNVGSANEIVLVGQLDMARAMELTETKSGREIHHWTVAAVYPATATDTSQPALGAMVKDGAISDRDLAAFVVGDGAFGPIMKLDGLQKTDFAAQEAVRKTVEGKVTMAASPVLIDPFDKGRKAGLAASDDGKVFAGVVAAIALLCLGFGLYRRWMKRSIEEPYI